MTFHLKYGGVKLPKILWNKKKLIKKVNRLGQTKKTRLFVFQALAVAIAIQISPLSVTAQDINLSTTDTGLTPSLSFDTKRFSPLALVPPKPIEIKIGLSYAQEAAKRTNPSATVRIYTKTAEPDFAAKRALAQKAAASYGVPWQIVEAVWQIESGKSWDTSVRSYAGAQGPAQFMPGTWRRYGVDADGDGHANIHDAEDAVYSAANYLAANGADDGQVRRALFAYNHADWYVNKVINLAQEIGYQG